MTSSSEAATSSPVKLLRSQGRGRISGLEVSRELAQVFTVRDGRVVQVVGYDDRARALQDTGLTARDAAI